VEKSGGLKLNEQPVISIVIPTYQHARYLDECIRSVLAQTYSNFEVIVVDDGSTDNTSEVLAKYGERIYTIRQDNHGLPAARNTGIRASKGEWIAFLDADDLWLPDKLVNQAEYFTNTKIGLIFCDCFYFTGDQVPSETAFTLYPPSKGDIFSRLFITNFIPMPTVIARRTCFDQCGLFDETLKSCEDYDLWLRISRSWHAEYVNKPLAKYRLSSNQMSRDHERMLMNLIHVKESYYQNGKEKLATLTQSEIDRGMSNLYLKLVKNYIQLGQNFKAFSWLQRYKEVRGQTPMYNVLWLAAQLPGNLMRNIFSLVDRVHYRQDLGQY
jgi:glycosyltransferase involved in cell wall biosynthesis